LGALAGGPPPAAAELAKLASELVPEIPDAAEILIDLDGLWLVVTKEPCSNLEARLRAR
jgi:hypothetical protein